MDQVVDFIVKNTSAQIVGASGELFNPYAIKGPSIEKGNDRRYLEANIPGIIKKMQEFSLAETEKISEQSLKRIQQSLLQSDKATHIDVGTEVAQLVSLAHSWRAEHLFPSTGSPSIGVVTNPVLLYSF